MKESNVKIGLWLAALALLVPTISATAQGKSKAALKNPAAMKDKAPAKFKAQFETTKGTFVVDVTRAWAPNGADRFYNLVKYGFFDGTKFFRVLPGFMAQFGIHGDPAIAAKWQRANISDDKVVESNKRGFVTFATAGPNTRTTQLFINYGDNARLDASGFSPFGKVSKGMEVVDKIFSGYGEQPDQGAINAEGNKYLEANWPKLDAIKKATLVK
jgi:peptidyl-prolyl cis-trans isomerase A (cyclophilin A)